MMKEKKNDNDDRAMILVVDDDESFRSLLRLFLENHGYVVCEAGDGREALRVFAEQEPQLILMDADMPVP